MHERIVFRDYKGYKSNAHIFLEFFELGAKESEVTVDFFAIGHHSVDLVSKSHVLCFLGDKVVLAE